MEPFGKQLANKILSLFMSQHEGVSLAQPVSTSGSNAYLCNSITNREINILVQLTPKSNIFQTVDVLKLTLAHSDKQKVKKNNEFQDVDILMNDDEHSLEENLKFIERFLISACFLSPYINFQNNKQLDFDPLRRKFFLDYLVESVEFKAESQQKQPIPALQSGYEVTKVIESSTSILKTRLWIANNLEIVLSQIKTIEIMKERGNRLQTNVKRNRFYSEEINSVDVPEQSSKIKPSGFRRSELPLAFSEDKPPFNKVDAAKRPFLFANELTIGNFEEVEGEDDNQTVSQDQTDYYSLSMYKDETSTFSKTQRDVANTQTSNPREFKSQDWEETGTVENLYCMAFNINQLLAHKSVLGSEDNSLSSFSGLVLHQVPQSTSSVTVNKRSFIKFGS